MWRAKNGQRPMAPHTIIQYIGNFSYAPQVEQAALKETLHNHQRPIYVEYKKQRFLR